MYGSEHPLAQAVIRKAKENDIAIANPDLFESISGHGLKATYSNHTILIGNRKMMEDNRIMVTESIDAKLSTFEKEGRTAVLVTIDNTLSGMIVIADTIKENAKDTIKALKSKELE